MGKVAAKVTATELAVQLCVSEDAIRKATACGRLTRDDLGLYDASTAAQEWAQNRKAPPRSARGKLKARPTETLLEVQTRHEKVKLREREVKVAELEANLIDIRAAEKQVWE